MASRLRAFRGAVAALLLLPGLSRAEDVGIILLGGLQQRVELEYLYNARTTDQDTGDSSTRTRQARETYRFSIDYAVLHPDLWVGNLALGLGLSQDGGSLAGTNFEHDFTAIFYKRKPVYFSLFTKKQESHVMGLLSDSYVLDQTSYGASVNGNNLSTPFQVDYTKLTSRTDGLDQDYTRNDWSLTGLVRHTASGLSDSRLRVQHVESSTDAGGGDADSETKRETASATNTLSWQDTGRTRSLDSSLDYTRSKTTGSGEDTKTDNLNWREALNWQFGKALNGGLQWGATRDRTGDSSSTSSTYNGFLEHRLVDALRTRAEVGRLYSTQDQGKERRTFWGVLLGYTKRIPLDGYFTFAPTYRKTYVEQDLEAGLRPVVNEPHTATLLGRFTLDQTRVQQSAIVVWNADPQKRIPPYETPRDYQVETVGDLTVLTIPAGSEISADAGPGGTTALLVSYTYEVPVSDGFQETSYSFDGAVDLFGGALRVYGNWLQRSRKYASEASAGTSDERTRNGLLGVAARTENGVYRVDYDYSTSDDEQRKNLRAEALWRYRFGWNFISLSLTDLYTSVTSEAEDEASATSKSNTLGARAAWQRPLLGGDSLNLSGAYYRSSGDSGTGDYGEAGLTYDFSYGKFTLQIQSKVTWRFYDTGKERQDFFWLKVTRYI